jgi:hypothetical protein
MTEGALLFFVGVAGVVVIARIYAALWPVLHPSPAVAGALFIVALLTVTGPLAWLALGALEHHYHFGTWTFANWVVLGDGIALLIGIVAGVILLASINAVDGWTAEGSGFWTAVGLAAGPGLAVLALFVLAVPGIRQSLGLTSIKAGEVEIDLTPPTSAAPPNLNYLFLPQADSSGLKGYTPWFSLLWPMVANLDCKAGEGFFKQGYFNREFNYLHLVDAIDLPLTEKMVPKIFDDDTKAAIVYQHEFLHWLKPVVGCAGFYHKFSPPIFDVQRHIGAWNDLLAALEVDLEQGLEHPDDVKDDLERLTAELPKHGYEIVQKFKNAIPAVLLKAKPEQGPSSLDCTQPYAPLDSRWVQVRYIQPPYLAMFLAESYGALGEKDAGLKVLTGWLKYYEGRMAADPKVPKWLLDRAYFEYGLVQEANEPVPTTYPEHFYLEKMEIRFKDWESKAKGYHWQVDLENNGATCGSAQAHRDDEGVGANAAAAESLSNFPQYDELGAEARLHSLYANIAQRLLFSVIATKSGVNGEFVDEHEEDLARHLLASAERCLAGENNDAREFRIAWNQAAGGMLLARRAADGVSGGLVTKSQALEMRKTALRALLKAHQTFLHNEQKDEREPPDGPLHVAPSDWEAPRRLVERQVIDLETSLTN